MYSSLSYRWCITSHFSRLIQEIAIIYIVDTAATVWLVSALQQCATRRTLLILYSISYPMVYLSTNVLYLIRIMGPLPACTGKGKKNIGHQFIAGLVSVSCLNIFETYSRQSEKSINQPIALFFFHSFFIALYFFHSFFNGQRISKAFSAIICSCDMPNNSGPQGRHALGLQHNVKRLICGLVLC